MKIEILNHGDIVSTIKVSEGSELLVETGNKKESIVCEKIDDDEKYSRTSLIVQKEKYEKIKHIAYVGRCNIKDVVEYAFDEIIDLYEKKYGEIKIKGKGTKQDLFA